MIKKMVALSTLFMIAIFISGCVDYKAYDLEETNDSLVNDIAQVEEGITEDSSENNEPVEEVVEENVELPELADENQGQMEVGQVTINVKENERIKLNVQVTDPDNDPVTYTFTPPLSDIGEWKTNYGDAGEYVSTLSATDGKLTTEKDIKILVERVNVPPTLETFNNIVVQEGEVVTFNPVVSDPNGDEVTITVSEPLAQGEFNTDHTSAGEYRIVVTATDGELESTQEFTLTIEDVNVLPEVSGLERTITVQEGDVVKIEPSISDLDDDPVTVTISDPVGDDGVWETSFTDHGEYVITVTVSDVKDVVKETVTVIVEDVNMPPEIVDVSLQT